MKDEKIISLFFKRDERALDETERKYGNLIRYIASNILPVPEDAEECVNDVYLALWNSIPPTEPQNLSAFASEITRRQAMKKLRHNRAEKRGGFSVVGEEFLSMLDDGKKDEKIIAIPFTDPTYNGYRSIFALPRHVYEEMRHFFSVYKNLENKETAVDEVCSRDDAVKIIAEAIAHYKECFC